MGYMNTLTWLRHRTFQTLGDTCPMTKCFGQVSFVLFWAHDQQPTFQEVNFAYNNLRHHCGEPPTTL